MTRLLLDWTGLGKQRVRSSVTGGRLGPHRRTVSVSDLEIERPGWPFRGLIPFAGMRRGVDAGAVLLPELLAREICTVGEGTCSPERGRDEPTLPILDAFVRKFLRCEPIRWPAYVPALDGQGVRE